MAGGEKTLRARWLAMSLMAVLLGGVSGCGGGGGGNKILYALGLGSPSVAVFTVSSSGTLTSAGSVTTGAAPNAIGIDPLLRFAYIVDSGGGIGPGGVSQYVLTRSTGALTVATLPAANGNNSPSTPIETGVGPAAIAIDGTGVFAFVANTGAIPANSTCSPTPSVCVPSISVYTIDSTGGALTEVKQSTPPPINCTANNPIPCPLPLLPSSVVPSALATTGNMLFVSMSNAGAGSVATYTFDSTGKLTGPTSTAAAGTNPAAIAMDPSGKFLFVADPATNTVAAFSVGSSGQLTAVGSPIATGTTPVSLHIHPRANFLYAANRGSNTISAFSFDSTGSLTPLSGSPFAAGNGPSYVTTDASANFLFVANSGSNNISVFTIDSSGVLKLASSSSFVVVNPIALASIN
jgi:6-phosphogluconolactonase (cycloisomerase 2 family)